MRTVKIIEYYYSEGYQHLSNWGTRWFIKFAVQNEDTQSLKELFKLNLKSKLECCQIKTIIKYGDFEKLKFLKNLGKDLTIFMLNGRWIINNLI